MKKHLVCSLLLLFCWGQLVVNAKILTLSQPLVSHSKEAEFMKLIDGFCKGKDENFCSKQNLKLIFTVRKEKLEKELQTKLEKLKKKETFIKNMRFRMINELFFPRLF